MITAAAALLVPLILGLLQWLLTDGETTHALSSTVSEMPDSPISAVDADDVIDLPDFDFRMRGKVRRD